MPETLTSGRGVTPPAPGSPATTLFNALLAVDKETRAHTREDLMEFAEESDLEIPDGLSADMNKTHLVHGLWELFRSEPEDDDGPPDIIDTTGDEDGPAEEASDDEDDEDEEAPEPPPIETPKPSGPAPVRAATPRAAKASKAPKRRMAKALSSGRYKCCGSWIILEKGKKADLSQDQYEHLKRVGKVR